MNWNLAEAEGRLSEVLSRAAAEGPQIVRRQSEDFVVLPKAKYELLVRQHPTFKDWLLNGPSLEGVDLDRDRSIAPLGVSLVNPWEN